MLRALLEPVSRQGLLLELIACTPPEAYAILTEGPERAPVNGRDALHGVLETHIHGPLRLAEDVAYLAVDASFLRDEISAKLDALSARYALSLRVILERRVRVDAFDDAFRGPILRPIARRTLDFFEPNRTALTPASSARHRAPS